MAETKTNEIQISLEQISYLAKNYSTLDYAQNLRSLLVTVYNEIDFSRYSKRMLHKYLNDFLLAHYPGEMTFKHQLFRRAATKKLVAAFETRVQDSRVDFLTINGVSSSYEIKSDLDNLDKLCKQAQNYQKVFEYNYLVINARHKCKAITILPASFGILRFSKGRQIVERDASLNGTIDANAQLSMLTKKELASAFNGINRHSEIRNRFSDQTINNQFKSTLKLRYSDRWKFLVEHRNEILPIDLQFFFNRNIKPSIIYNHG